MKSVEKAVILAAGRGRRMGALTDELPKPLLPIGGKPLLDRILDGLASAGFGKVFLVTGYRADLIEEHCRDHPLEIEFQRQERLNGTATAALLAREFVGQDSFLLTHGDILAEAGSYGGMAAAIEDDPSVEGVLGVKYVPDPWQGAAVYTDARSRVTRIVEKPPRGGSQTHWNSAGLYAFRPTLFDYLARVPKSGRGEYELTSAVEAMLGDGLDLVIHALEGAWRDVGRPEDITAAERFTR